MTPPILFYMYSFFSSIQRMQYDIIFLIFKVFMSILGYYHFFHKSENKELPLSLYMFSKRAKIRTILANLIWDLN